VLFVAWSYLFVWSLFSLFSFLGCCLIYFLLCSSAAPAIGLVAFYQHLIMNNSTELNWGTIVTVIVIDILYIVRAKHYNLLWSVLNHLLRSPLTEGKQRTRKRDRRRGRTKKWRKKASKYTSDCRTTTMASFRIVLTVGPYTRMVCAADIVVR
jgi:hypothetical protein